LPLGAWREPTIDGMVLPVQVAAPAATTDVPLRRAISGRMLFFFILGDILGAGIYALVGEVASEVGGAVWAAFGVALLLAFLTAFAYAELITKYPHAGGAALFVNRAFRLPFFTFMVGFAVMASGVTSAATLATAFGGDYFQEFLSAPSVLVSLLFIGVVTLINFRGISESVKTNMVLTLVELTGLVIIVGVGVWALVQGDVDAGRNFDIKGGENLVVAVLAGATLAFYALIGFEDSANVAEETQDPRRAYPRALFAGIVVAGVVYLLVTFVASMVVPTRQLEGSDAPLLEVVREGSGLPLKLFSAIALLAVANGALINLIMASRLLYGMSKERVAPPLFGIVHPFRRTPWVAIGFTTILALVLVAIGNLGDLAATTVMLLLIVFSVVNVAVLVLRREPVEHDHFVTPLIFPILALVVIAVLFVKRMTEQDLTVLVITLTLLAIGAALWLLTRLVSGRAGTEPIPPEPRR
jgi:APA family basic amino acid/polyamine antiporter